MFATIIFLLSRIFSEDNNPHLKVAYKGTGTDKAGPSDQGATAVSEIDTGHDRDARAIFERSKQANEARKIALGEGGSIIFYFTNFCNSNVKISRFFFFRKR